LLLEVFAFKRSKDWLFAAVAPVSSAGQREGKQKKKSFCTQCLCLTLGKEKGLAPTAINAL